MTTSSTTVSENNRLFRKLSNVLLINSLLFGKASATEQTAVLTENQGVPVLFVTSFGDLSNRRKIRDKLLAGEDVSMELEFNGVTLSDEDRRVLTLVAPILEKITGIKSKYPWLEPDKAVSSGLASRCGSTKVQNSQGYAMRVEDAQKVWDFASKYWADLELDPKTPAPSAIHVDTLHSQRVATVTSQHVNIGCQSMQRKTVEAIARHYGWEPNVN